MVHQCAEVQILGDDKALLLHSPPQDGHVRHVRIYIADKEHVNSVLLESQRYAAPDVVVEQQPQRYAVHAVMATG